MPSPTHRTHRTTRYEPQRPDANFFLAMFDFERTDIPPERCCDSCLAKSNLELPFSLSSLLPEYIRNYLEEEQDASDTEDQREHDDNDPPLNPTTNLKPSKGRMAALTPTQIDAFQNALRSLRNQIWKSELPRKNRLGPFRDSVFLTDKEVSRLSLKGHRILEREDIAKHLKQNKNFHWTPIAPYIKDILQCLRRVVWLD